MREQEQCGAAVILGVRDVRFLLPSIVTATMTAARTYRPGRWRDRADVALLHAIHSTPLGTALDVTPRM